MTESLKLLLPEVALSAAALVLLMMDVLVMGRRLKNSVLTFSVLSLLAALCLVVFSPPAGRAFGMVVSDGFAAFFKVIAIVSALVIFLLSEDDPVLMGPYCGTYAALILLSTVGVLFLSGAEDLLILFVALELTTVPLFVLAGFLRRDLRSSEGAIKFFLVGAFSAGLMVYGISFLYGLCGSTQFAAVRNYLAAGPADLTLFMAGVFFLLVGLGFKLSLVPFHQWTPDTYEGAPTPITAFFSVSREAGVIVVMLRFFGEYLNQNSIGLTGFFALLSVLTMTVGNVTALKQDSLKRLLAYSSIAHAGTIFIGVVAGNALGRQGVMLYSLAYSLMSLGAFAVVIAVWRVKNSDRLDAVSGLAKENFGLAVLMLFFLLSLSGIPPFLGFLGKFYVFAAAIRAGMYWLVAAGLINTVISVYYYFRIVHKMFFEDPQGAPVGIRPQWSIRAATAFAAAAILILGLFPEGVLSWISLNFQALP